MKREIQAEQVFKYYRLPKWKVVEPDGMFGGKNMTTMREIIKGRDSPVIR